MTTSFRPALLARLPVLALALALSGCISLGGEPPESLLTLSPSARAPAGPGVAGGAERAVIAVLPFDTPAKLDVLRVPVAVSDTELAYLQEAYWVEKPARLFRRVVGETIRARGTAMVVDGDDVAGTPGVTLQGTLTEMGYDAATGEAVVRFDAVRIAKDGAVATRRFEAKQSGVTPDARSVGAGLNAAANTVAAQVAEWVAPG
ncbi:ABC-type transport auxiliary lipoprotein family protein [Porphyrobacter sp. AAP82]|uniref:ABC-type transport auxiliary lipoprotein family protein n=1 Tax=Porphyrobacter sp. AAP82 TaxID=1248917 RepID=UPI00031DCCE4|nr:ABC-type transport auxiliary lipoprotein family protein [Porphyrobacter sp. AAP82]